MALGTFDSRTFDSGTFDSRTFDSRTFDSGIFDRILEHSTVNFVNKGKTAKNVNQLSFCGTFDSENAFLKIKSYMKINDLNVTKIYYYYIPMWYIKYIMPIWLCKK